VRCRSLSSSLSRCVYIGGRQPRCGRAQVAASHDLLVGLFRDEVDLCVSAVPGGFTRRGVLSPSLLVTLLLFMAADAGQHGYQCVLDAFWDEAQRAGIELPGARAPTAASFCNARKKLRPQALRSVLRTLAGGLLAREAPRWRGLRVFAIDGSRFSVRRSAALWQSCGAPRGGGTPQVQITTLFELFGEVPLDVDVGPFGGSERVQAGSHLDCLRPGDLLVLDRGYPSFALLRDLIARGLHFAVRVPNASTFAAVAEFLASGRDDARIQIAPSWDFLQAHGGGPCQPLHLRALRLRAPDGSRTVILTSLPARQFCLAHVANLYRRRWRIEEHYKLVKSEHFGQRQFHAKSFEGVAQEIYAQALMLVVTRSLASSAFARKPAVSLRPTRRIHVKAAVAAVSRHLVELLLHDEADRLAVLVANLHEQIRRRVQPLRPGRSWPRRSFKPSSKWHALGRRGAALG